MPFIANLSGVVVAENRKGLSLLTPHIIGTKRVNLQRLTGEQPHVFCLVSFDNVVDNDALRKVFVGQPESAENEASQQNQREPKRIELCVVREHLLLIFLQTG